MTGIIIPELSSSRTRGKIMGFSLAVHWVRLIIFFLECRMPEDVLRVPRDKISMHKCLSTVITIVFNGLF